MKKLTKIIIIISLVVIAFGLTTAFNSNILQSVSQSIPSSSGASAGGIT